MTPSLTTAKGVRVAIEGCGHGTLNAIYASIEESCKARGWDGVDLVIIGGDFQSVRDAADLSIMSCPVKYRSLGDFPDYYAGKRTAPYTTVFIGGNHEASSHLWELYYGGWVAPNIYYLGAVNVIRFGPLRIAAMSGIWAGHDYRKPHHERLPFTSNDVRTFYHVREYDTRKLLQLRTQVDIGLSHDWPRGIEKHGDSNDLFRRKGFFRQESMDGTLGNVAAAYVLDRLRPPYWFSAHLHVKYSAIKRFPTDTTDLKPPAALEASAAAIAVSQANPDEIDLDMEDDDDDEDVRPQNGQETKQLQPQSVEGVESNQPIAESGPKDAVAANSHGSVVSDDLKAQLPASFFPAPQTAKKIPGQPVPAGIKNKEVRFLALDKCLPGRSFLQLVDIQPYDKDCIPSYPPNASGPRYRLQYDAEWLAITRVFHKDLVIGSMEAAVPADLGEDHYATLIDLEREWVEENITKKGILDVPDNFELTAPPYETGSPEIVTTMPNEYTNPQTAAFCTLLEIKNHWHASTEEREERKADMLKSPEDYGDGERRHFGGGRGGGGGGRGRGRGGRGGRGGSGRGRGRGGGRGGRW